MLPDGVLGDKTEVPNLCLLFYHHSANSGASSVHSGARYWSTDRIEKMHWCVTTPVSFIALYWLTGDLKLMALLGGLVMATTDAVADGSVYSSKLINVTCPNGKPASKGQLFTFLSFPGWEQKGWIMGYEHSAFDTSTPVCLTKENNQTLTMRTCSYEKIRGFRRLADEK